MSFEHSIDDSSDNTTEAIPLDKLTYAVEQLVSNFRAYELPARKFVRYELPVDKDLYLELPAAIRQYVHPDSIKSWYLDFITESDDENRLEQRVAVSIPLTDATSELLLTPPRYDGAMEGQYPVFIVRDGGDSQEIGTIPTSDVTYILLRSIGASAESLEGIDLTTIDFLGVDHIDELEAAVEVYGSQAITSASYESDDAYLDHADGYTNDSNIPDKIYAALRRTPFSIDISTREESTIDILEDGERVAVPEERMVYDIIEHIQISTENLQLRSGPVEELTDPRELGGDELSDDYKDEFSEE